MLQADLTQPLELGLLLENFPRCKELIIPPGTCDYRVKLRIYDNIDRMLELLVNIKAGLGGSLKVAIVTGLVMVGWVRQGTGHGG